MKAHELLIEIENSPGALAKICASLGESQVNIKTITVDRIGNQGFVRVVVDNQESAEKELEKKGFLYSVNEVLIQTLDDKPNELGRLATILSAGGVNIDAVYMVGKANNKTQLVLALDNVPKAETLLKDF